MKWYYLFLVFIYGSCSQPLSTTDKMVKDEKETKLITNAGTKVSVIDTGYCFVNFLMSDDSERYKIEWGNNLYTHLSSNEYEVLGNGTLGVEYIDSSIVLLRQSCGTSCTYFVNLPLKKKGQDRLFYNPISYDKAYHLLAYLNTEDQPIVEVVDLVENKTVSLIQDLEFCPAALKIDCIRDSKFSNGTFELVWEGSNWQKDNKDLRTLTQNILDK